MIRILLVDDQAIVRQGWAMRFALEPDIAVAGLAGDGREAVARAFIGKQEPFEKLLVAIRGIAA